MNPDDFLKIIKNQLHTNELTEVEKGTFGQSYITQINGEERIVKVIRGVFSDELDKNLYIQQTERLALLRHPLLHPFSAIFINEKQTFRPLIVSRYLENGNLEMNMKENQFTATQKSIILAGVAAACAYLEAKDVSHFTLNPRNILLNERYEPIITGYGIGFVASKGCYIPPEWSTTYDYYMAPEPYKTQKSDIYSYAVLVFEVLTGMKPDPGFTCNENISYAYQKLINEIVNCSASFRVPFHVICSRFASGELVIPGTNMVVFNDFLRKVIVLSNADMPLRAKAFNCNLQAMIDLFPLVNDRDAIYLAYQGSKRCDTTSIRRLGYCYEKGIGIIKDRSMALKYYEIAMKHGDVVSKYHYGKLLYETEREESIKLIKEAADEGIVEAALTYAELAHDKRYYDVAYLHLGDDIQTKVEQMKDHNLELRYCQDIINTKEKMKKMNEYAMNGNTLIAYELGTLHRNEKEKSFKYFEVAAGAGISSALFEVGYCYMKGIAVEKDEKIGFVYFKRAIETPGATSETVEYFENMRDIGNPSGCFLFGYALLYGNGIEKDVDRARRTLQRAAELDSPDGSFLYYKVISKDNKVDKENAIKFAKMGSGDAAAFCAKSYFNGENGFEKDLKLSMEYWKLAAESDNTEGIFVYGVHLLYNLPSNERIKAYKLFERGKKLGDVNSETMLAVCMRDGICATYGLNKSKAVFEKLSKRCPLAKAYLALHSIANAVSEIDMHNAANLSEEAKDGCPDAMFILGKCYAEGIGIIKDENEARKCFEEAVKGQLLVRQQTVEYKPGETEAYRYFSINSKWNEFADKCKPFFELVI